MNNLTKTSYILKLFFDGVLCRYQTSNDVSITSDNLLHTFKCVVNKLFDFSLTEEDITLFLDIATSNANKSYDPSAYYLVDSEGSRVYINNTIKDKYSTNSQVYKVVGIAERGFIVVDQDDTNSFKFIDQSYSVKEGSDSLDCAISELVKFVNTNTEISKEDLEIYLERISHFSI